MARIKLDGDAAGLLAAQRKVRDETKRMDDEFNKVLETNKDLERQVKRTWEQARPALERYNEKVRRLRDLHKQEKITQDQLNFSLQRLRQSYERTERAQKDAFGASATAQLARFLGTVVGIETAVGKVREAFQNMEEIRVRSATSLRADAPGIGSLASLARDEAHLNALIQSMDTARRLGLQTDQASGLVFQLESASRLNNRNLQLVAQGAATGMIQDPTATTEALTTVINNLDGTMEDTLDMMTAGAQATKATPVQFLQAMTVAAQQAKDMGITREDLAAMITVTTGTSRQPVIGGTQVEAFLAQIEKARVRGFDIQGTTSDELIRSIENIMATQGLSAFEILSEKEAVRGFRAMRDRRDRIGISRQAITEGIETDLYNSRLQTLLNNEIVGQELRNRQLTQQRDLLQQEHGLLRLRQENVSLERQILEERQGRSMAQRAGATMTEEAAMFVGGDEEVVRAAGQAGARGIESVTERAARNLPMQVFGAILNTLNSIDRKTTEPAPVAVGARPEN